MVRICARVSRDGSSQPFQVGLGHWLHPSHGLLRIWVTALSLAGLLAGVPVQSAEACSMLAEFELYPNGATLDGQGGTAGAGTGTSNQNLGALWTSDWAVEGSTPSTAFVIENQRIVASDTGGDLYQVSRSIDVSNIEDLGVGPEQLPVPINQPETSFAQFSLSASDIAAASAGGSGGGVVGGAIAQALGASSGGVSGQSGGTLSGPGEWNAGMQFSDGSGIVAALGMESDGASTHFYAQLGGSAQTSTETVDTNETYEFYLAFRPGQNPGDQDSLKVWINPDMDDFFSNTNPTIEITDELGVGRETLGTEMSFVAQTSSDNSVPAPVFRWANSQLARDANQLAVPRLDIGPAGSAVQTAWEGFEPSSTPTSSINFTEDLSVYYPTLIPGQFDMDITIETTDGSNLGFFDYTFATQGVDDDLRGDGVSGVDGLIVKMANLMGDQWPVRFGLYDESNATEVQFSVSYDNGVTWTVVAVYTTATGNELLNGAFLNLDNLPAGSNTFPANGNPIWVKLEPTTPGETVQLTSIQFLPEPGTAVLTGLGLCALGIRARRQRNIESGRGQ